MSIESIEGRLAKASEGEWYSDGPSEPTVWQRSQDPRQGDVPIAEVVFKAEDADFIARSRADIPLLLAVAKAAADVMRKLQKYGPGIVPHLMDTDDNAGQELRESLVALEEGE